MKKDINERLTEVIKNKKAVIWDFDGVICFANWEYYKDTEKWWNNLWSLLEEFDQDIRKKFSKGLKYYYEHTDYIVQRFGKKALDKINDFYLKREMMILPYSPINKPVVKLLNDLDPDIEHFIWSNNQEEFVSKSLEKAGIMKKFRAIISRNKVTLAKPNIHGFKFIRKLTSVPIKDFVFVGDSRIADEIVAKKLGMDFFFYSSQSPFEYKDLLNKWFYV